MDSRKLRHFLAVADHGGFTAAAQAVYVSQPALSLAVKELEAEVGAALFTRSGRSVRLTAAGEAPLGPARQVMRDLSTGQAAVAAVSSLMAGHLSLASLPTLVADPLAPLVGTLRRHHSGVRIDLAAPEDTTELIDMVVSGSSELGVTEDHDLPDQLVSHGMGQQRLVLILPPGTAHDDGAPLRLRELGDTPFVAPLDGGLRRRRSLARGGGRDGPTRRHRAAGGRRRRRRTGPRVTGAIGAGVGSRAGSP
jgi:LysR family carnitine catabolism transcriptional activator